MYYTTESITYAMRIIQSAYTTLHTRPNDTYAYSCFFLCAPDLFLRSLFLLEYLSALILFLCLCFLIFFRLILIISCLYLLTGLKGSFKFLFIRFFSNFLLNRARRVKSNIPTRFTSPSRSKGVLLGSSPISMVWGVKKSSKIWVS